MDTKERKRRAPAGKARKSGAKAQPVRGRTTAKPARKRASVSSAEARKRAAAAASRKRQSVARSNQPRRVVRAPREDVPRVSYTMPKPFSRGGFLLRLVSVAAAVAAVLMCLSLFFRVEQVVVSGAEKYTPYKVMEASGIAEGDSLLSISDARISGKVISALPYVKEVRVGIKLPGTVHIEIKELEMTYAIQASDSTWWLIAADGRVIEQIESSAASGYTRILGVEADGPRADHQVLAAEPNAPQTTDSTDSTDATAPTDGVALPTVAQVTGAQRLEVVLTILAGLEENGIIGQIEYIDVTNLNNITMEYGQRLDIVLGTWENLPYKLAYMAQAITQLPDYETGELDVSFKYSDKALLNPES